MRRVSRPELLDSDLLESQELAAALADLRWVNRWCGGIGTTLDMVAHVARRLRSSTLSLLDVAAGSGDVPSAIQRILASRGVRVEVTLFDRRRTHLPTNANPAQFPLPPNHGLKSRCVAGDALALPFGDASFDLVTCALFAHHLEPAELVRFVGEALRVARTAVLINDLQRSVLSWALVYAGYPLFHSAVAWRDGLVSVRRAYTPQELRALLARSPAAHIELRKHYLFRMGAIAWKNGAWSSLRMQYRYGKR